MNNAAKEMLERRGLESDIFMMEDYLVNTHRDIPQKRIPYAEYLLHWERAKEAGGLFRLFNGQLMISKQISVVRTTDEIISMMDTSEFHYEVRELRGIVRDIVFSIIGRYICNEDQAHSAKVYFGDNYRWRYEDTRQIFEDVLNSDIANFYKIASYVFQYSGDKYVWLDNKVELNGMTFAPATLPNCTKKLTLQDGVKPFRMVSRFIEFIRNWLKEANIEDEYVSGKVNYLETILENVRQEASMLNNERKFSGRMVLSIHPMDFMTMSEPENGWSSCMRWDNVEPGEYHAGTLEMMTSSCVVVAYLESKSKIENIGGTNFSWNKKNWRELFVVDPNFISGIKGYPYKNENLENQAFEMLVDLAKKNWNVNFNIDNICKTRDEDGTILGMRLKTNFMYNDWECCWTRFIVAEGVTGDDLPDDYYYGDTCYCVVCGKDRGSYSDDEGGNTDELWDVECSGYSVCPICGCRRHILVEAPDGRFVCSDCLQEFMPCSVCHEQHHRDEMLDYTLTMGNWCNNCGMYHRYALHFYTCPEHSAQFEEMLHPFYGGYRIRYLNKERLELLKDVIPELSKELENGSKIDAIWNEEGNTPNFILKG